MPKKLINKDPFSNGTEFMMFEAQNCDRCFKSSEIKEDGTYTNAGPDNMPRCSIQRDIVMRMGCNDPIKEETVKICHDFVLKGTLCPYIRTERKRRPKRVENQTELF